MTLPSLDLQDPLLSSQIPLPPRPYIVYAKFAPSSSAGTIKPYQDIEAARQHLLYLNASRSLLESLLASAYTGQPAPHVYVFAISSCGNPTPAVSTLQALHFDNMPIKESGSFFLNDVYACSMSCSLLQAPCQDCRASSSASITFIPRKPLRVIYSFFLEAVRIRLLDDIVKTSHIRQPSMSTYMQVQRLQGGFLFGYYTTIARPLVFCHLQLLLRVPLNELPCLVVHPILIPTPYTPLGQISPLPSGTPIVLLPHGTPAYYRAAYEGPTAALVEQFKKALHGLGVTNWDNSQSDLELTDGPNRRREQCIFIIAQIVVENKQGADKGVLIIYPTALCLSLAPLTGLCQPLEHMLDLPAPLQPSPQAPSVIPIQPYGVNSPSPRTQPDWGRMQWNISSTYSTIGFPTSLQPLRSFTFSNHENIHRVAEEVGSYVEAVARERERERERLKREREGASSSPRLVRVVTSNAPTTSGPLSVDTYDRLFDAAVLQSASPQTNFYPSPPPANSNIVVAAGLPTSPGADNSPPVETTSLEAVQKDAVQNTPPSDSRSNANYDLFNNIDSTWPRPSQTYIGMDLDFDISMGLGMAEDGNERDVFLDVHHNTDFEDAFTDDDFNFFDQPSRTTPLALAIASSDFPIPQPRFDLLPKPANKTENEFSSIPGHFIATASTYDHFDKLLPAFTDPDARLPGLSPASEQTPEAQFSPMTPDVHLDHNMLIPDILASPFDPIPFAPYHRVSDRKYLRGKFALSSPKGEEFLPNTITVFTPDPSSPSEGWRSKYDAITDPRVGMVQRLIRVKKRKRASSHTLNNEIWMQDEYGTEHDADSSSETESDAVEVGDGDSNNDLSRPATPPPYLPLGSSLLCTFVHALLLSIGTPLSFPDSANVPASSIPIPISVPTPVSPAATLGAAVEKIKSLEAIASIMASEVVENSVWALAWNSTAYLRESRTNVWRTDVKRASLLLDPITPSESTLNIASLFGIPTSHPLKPLEPPLIAIGKGGNVIHLLPTALKFWEKLGLTPKSGKKDVTLFVVYDKEGDSDQRELQVDSWLESIKATYTARSYGNLQLGRFPNCLKPGHFPARYDSSLRKTITCLISSLTPVGHHYALLFSVPNSIMTFTSPVLRLAITSMRKALKDRPDIDVIYQLVPEYQLFGPLQAPSDHRSFVITLCSSIYDRTPSIVRRSTSRKVLGSPGVKAPIEAPAFTLARRLPHRVSFAWEARSMLDVVDHHTLMHVGYQVSTCGKWLVAACIDQRGEAHDVGIWFMRTAGAVDEAEVSDELYIVRRVWDFARSFSEKANLEWRIVITKSGVMSEVELDAWIRHLENEMSHEPFPPLQVSVLCAEVQTPWFVNNPRPNFQRLEPNPNPITPLKDSILIDISSETFMLTPQTQLPLSLPIHISLSQSLISDNSPGISELERASDESTDEKQRIPHPFTLLPRSSTKLIRSSASTPTLPLSMLDIHLLHVTAPCPDPTDERKLHQEITYNFYELSLLAKLRKLNANPILPFHLGAVDLMQTALERDSELLEAMTDA